MLKLRRDQTPLNGEDYKRFGELVNEVLDARDGPSLKRWLDNSLQPFIPHDLMVVAWGDFHLGVIHFDTTSGSSAITSEAIPESAFKSLLAGLFDRWTANGRKAFAMNVGLTSGPNFTWGTEALPISLLDTQKSCMVHGVSDQKGKHDYLYVFFSTQPKRRREETNAIKVLLPYLDVAFRQVSHSEPASKNVSQIGVDIPLEVSTLDATKLSPKEVEIMQLVAAGGSNEEISNALDMSSFTLKSHMQKIFMKLDVFNRAQAISTFKNLYQPSRIDKVRK